MFDQATISKNSGRAEQETENGHFLLITMSQCENFMIFLSFKFHVKSIWRILKV